MEEKTATTLNLKRKPENTSSATPTIAHLYTKLPKFSRV